MGLLSRLALTGAARAETPRLAELDLEQKAVGGKQSVWERAKYGGAAPVANSPDLERILALPRRSVPSAEEQVAMAAEMTERLRLPEAPCECASLSREPCIRSLLPVQGWYLYEAGELRGALGHIVVGGGKTGIDILLAMAVPGVRRALLLIPPGLRAQFALDYRRWSQHFRVPNLVGGKEKFWPGRPVLDVLAYSQLSRERAATWFAANRPDLVIADEAQAFKDKAAVGTSRFIRYFVGAEAARLCVHSGSITTRSLDDYAHLSALSLRGGSPLPLASSVVRQWCSVLDPDAEQTAPTGALARLCEPGETPRDGFCRRLLSTPGVISTADAALPTRLSIRARDPGVLPPDLAAVMANVRRRQKRPDGEELVEAVEVAACCRQLASGFFYRWRYPRGESAELIASWFSRRQSWHRALREKLERRRDRLDSPKLVRDAAERARDGYRGELPVWRCTEFEAWAEIELEVQPVQDTVWLDDYLVRDAAIWMREHVGIVWTGFSAFARRLAEVTGAPYYGPSNTPPVNLAPTAAMQAASARLAAANEWPGDTSEGWIQTEQGDRSILAARRAHGTGRNLQAFHRGLVQLPPGDEGDWEQMLGRMHRRHQAAGSVEVDVYLHTPEFRSAWEDAQRRAEYVQRTTGAIPKIIAAEFVGPSKP